jgi:hypothetical protein
MNRKIFTHCFSALLLVGACLGAGLAISALINAPAKAEEKSAETKPPETTPASILSIKGTCTFMNQPGTWSAKLTPTDTPGVYDAKYVANWTRNQGMNYVGQIKSDFKTTISGNGKFTSGGNGNGSFEFSGNYGDDGIAKCNYKEIGGQRSGPLTAEKPQ